MNRRGPKVKLARQLEEYNILCFEDPFPWAANPAQYHLLRQRTDIPIAPHCGRGHADDVLNLLKAEAADLFNLGGNVAQVQRCSAVASRCTWPPRSATPRSRTTSCTTCATTTCWWTVPSHRSRGTLPCRTGPVWAWRSTRRRWCATAWAEGCWWRVQE